MLFSFIRNLLTLILNVLIWLWNLLPLGPSWKVEPIGASSSSPPSNETPDGNERTQRDNTSTSHERKEQYIWLARLLIALAIPVILETLDYTVVATAQPRIASSFNRLDLQSYIGTVYLLTSTVFLPLFASIADVYGRHAAMQLSLVFFLIGSAISTGAQNMPMMLAGRGIAGIGAAGMLTVLRTILADTHSLSMNNVQSAIMTVLYTIGFCIGPVIGGALTEISFRWVFAINLPAATVSMILIFVPLRKHTRRPLFEMNLSRTDKLLHVDWTATLLFTVGGVGLLLGLNWGSTEGWDDAKVIVCLVVGAVLIGATIGWEAILERKQGLNQTKGHSDIEVSQVKDDAADEKNTSAAAAIDPTHLAPFYRARALLPLNVMGNFDVMATNLAAMTSGMVMLVVFYFVALFFVIVSGQSATHAGVQLLFFAPGLGIGTVVAMRMVSIFRQPKFPILLGGVIIPIAIGLVSMAIDQNKENEIKGFMVMAGIGVGMTFGPLAIHARFSLPSDRVAIVSALNLFFRSLGGTIGLAQCYTVTNAKVRAYFNGLPPSALSALQGIGTTSLSPSDITSLDQIESLPPAARELVQNAFRNGVRWSFISLIPWACVSLLACIFLKNIKDTDAARKGAEPTTEPASANAVDEQLQVKGIDDRAKGPSGTATFPAHSDDDSR